jgi:heterodisulfide reductase subunit C
MAQTIFALLTIGSIGFFLFKASKIRRNILLGRDEKISDNVGQRIKNVILIALGQKKMFKRWLPATLHFTIYAAFLITQIELLEIFIDGFSGNHRLIWHSVEGTFFGGIYTFIISFIEVLSVLALVATFAFLARRNLLKIPRFHKPEMNGWPKLDGNIILYLEIALVLFIFMMNSGDLALQAKGHAAYHHTDNFAISQFIALLWADLDTSTILLIERIGWWGHILTVFTFLNYLPFSKHLHIMLAFPNVYFARVEPKGEMIHLDSVTEQVNELFGEEEEPESIVDVMVLKSEKNPFKTIAVDESQKEESLDDIFGDTGGSEEGLDDIFGDLGSAEKEESLDDIFGDTGNSEETESLDDIFGDTGNSEETESLDDIFGDTGNSEETESLDDIFGDTGNSEETESLDDIFGDTGNSEETESLDDIFGDTGNSEETESVDDIFGDTGNSEETESVDDIFGNNEAESVDDIFGNSQEESVDDIFGNGKEEESIDDLFGDDKAKVTEEKLVVTEFSGRANPKSQIVEQEEDFMPKFGAGDVFDLSWKHILSSYSCTECGRCTDACPANITGKKLSPRKIMMDVRDRAEEVGKTLDANPNMTKENYDDGKDLFSYITEEELHACTTCNACVEACPVMISPLDIIVEMRRHLVLDEAKAPDSWNVMFTNIENNGAPWQFSSDDRDKWITE